MNCMKAWNIKRNKLYFEYVGPTKDFSFYEYYDSQELFNERFDEALKKKQKELPKKMNEVKMGNNTPEEKKSSS